VILEHLVLGLHTCRVPVFLPSFPLLCIPCLGSALQIHSSALTQCIHPPCVHPVHLDPSIAPLYLLRYSTADLLFVVNIQGKPHHRTHRTLQPTDHNNVQLLICLVLRLRARGNCDRWLTTFYASSPTLVLQCVLLRPVTGRTYLLNQIRDSFLGTQVHPFLPISFILLGRVLSPAWITRV
jgi:hypothetical protein